MRKHESLLFFLLIFILLTSCTREKVENIVVIGGGLMGSATAWHLANANEDVLVIEQQDSIYTYGSSLGDARIARSNNRSSDIWSYLHNRTIEEVEKLIAFLNEAEENPGFSMEDIYTTTPTNYVGLSRIHDQLLKSFETQKVDYKLAITPEEGKNLFSIEIPEGVLYHREYNQYTGTINPGQLISHLHKGIRKKGGRVHYGYRVESLKEIDGLFEIELTNLQTRKQKTILSKKVVTAAGPYTGKVLKNVAPYFQDLIIPQRVFLSFFKIHPDHWKTLNEEQVQRIADGYPVINSSAGTRKGSFFSMIEHLDEDGLPIIKIGGHHQRSNISNLDEVWKMELSEKEIDWSRTNTLNYLKMLDVPVDSTQLQYINGYSCVYSLTKTEVPYVTSIRALDSTQNKNLVVVGGMSGGGAKGTMTYGLIAAQLLTGQTEQDVMYNIVKEALGYERLLEDLKSE